MNHSSRLVVVAAAWAVGAAAAVSGAANMTRSYMFTSFGYPGAAGTDARAINGAGQIVGQWRTATGATHGYLLDDGVFRSIEVAGAVGTSAESINDNGIIVGGYSTLASVSGGGEETCCALHGLVRTPDNAVLTVDYPAPSAGLPSTWLWDISNNGQIVGEYYETEMVDSTPVVHIHSFMYDGATFTPIEFPSSSAIQTRAFGINDAGDVVGIYDTGFAWHGYVLRDGHYSTFDAPGSDFPNFTTLLDINNRGDIVGLSQGCSDSSFVFTVKRGFACITGTRHTRPDTFQVYALNDAAQLVGVGDGFLGYVATAPSASR
jgi:probable HAF family extracellular repeat protein